MFVEIDGPLEELEMLVGIDGPLAELEMLAGIGGATVKGLGICRSGTPPGPKASPASLGCLSSICFFMAEMRTNFLRQTGQLKVGFDEVVEPSVVEVLEARRRF